MNEAEIVVGIDGSKSAENALLWAAAEAQRRGVRLVIAYSGDAEPMPEADSDRPAPFGRALLTDAAELVLDSGIDCQLRTVTRDESAVAMLTKLGEHAELLVVGAHGLARTNGTSLGSVAYRVAAHAPCPVAVIGQRPASTQPFLEFDHAFTDTRPVGVGITSSPSGAPAVEFAFAEAALRHVAVNAVHSWAEIDWSEVSGTATLYRAGHDFRSYHEQRLASLLAPFRKRYPEVVVRSIVTGDPVSVCLADASEVSSMLVLGCRHRGGRLISRLGPTSTRLIYVARCPVVVVGHPSVAADPAAAALSMSSTR